jgi:adenylate cyclase
MTDQLPEPTHRWSTDPVASWLADHGGNTAEAVQFFDALCRRLFDSGIQLLRVACGLPALHPQVFAIGLEWTRGQGMKESVRDHNIVQTRFYLASPVAQIHQGAAAIRRRLDVPDAQLDFPILHDVKALGATDYLVLPLRFTRGRPTFMAWSTDRPGGFSEDELARLHDLMPLISLRLEVEATRRMTRDLLRTYLGRSASELVLGGQVQRGGGRATRAAIWVSDLRGFTAMTGSMSAHDLITVLDDYFDCMAGPVEQMGGEILKFVGDGVLAMFNAETDVNDACGRAYRAGLLALERLGDFNQGRAIGGGEPLRTGIALHLGEVIFGNVGAKERLDFTVIGAAVNEAVRTEGLCKLIGRPLVATADFAACIDPGVLERVGIHTLRGVHDPKEIWAAPLSVVGEG